MPVVNATIATIFEQIADLLDIQGANPFRVRAYRNAARTVGELGTDVKTLMERGLPLTDLPGVGDDLANKIREILATGRCQFLEQLEKDVPPGITQLMRLPGLGPKRVKTLWRDLDIRTLDQLLAAAQSGRIRALPGFGAKSERKLIDAVQRQLAHTPRMKLAEAAQHAEPLAAWLRGAPGAPLVQIAGSYRRMRETVGDLDIVVAADASGPVMDRLAHYEDLAQVLAGGPTRCTLILKAGLQVDVRVVPKESCGAALQYFTGSKAHNIAIRRMAQGKGLKINEYGVFRGPRRLAGETEESVYRALGLPWIAPELREDHGEIEAASRAELPELIEVADLRGDLHAHTEASDGHHGLEEMARAARALGLEYLAITEHSKRLTVAHGLDAARLAKQTDEIDRLNLGFERFALLKGIEVDILEDGTLDMPDSALARLDVVIAAVHSRFELPRAKQTARILKALDNPHVRILAHPTGRLIAAREAYDVDMQQIVRKAAARGIALEVNAHPERLDLIDAHCRMARDEGVLLAIDSDAHSAFELDLLRFGVGQARRGWVEKKDVLNARPLKALRKLLARGPAGR